MRFPRFSVRTWSYLFCLILPFLLLPLAISPGKEARCAFVIILVACYWVLEPIAMPVTALLPIVLYPLLGILGTAATCVCYMREVLIMFIGGLTMAVAVEDCRLHERIALRVLMLLGSDTKKLMLGFMLTTMFLSMWISNTASTAMMLPIADAVMKEVRQSNGVAPTSQTEKDEEKHCQPDVDGTVADCKQNGDAPTFEPKKSEKSSEELPYMEQKETDPLKIALFLGVAYSANCGGTGSITGTSPNLIFKGMMEEFHPNSTEITFATWMMYNVPGMVICVFLIWAYLYLIGVRRCCRAAPPRAHNIAEAIAKKYKELGRMRFREGAILGLFLTLVFLWYFRDPKFIPGWTTLFPEVPVGGATPAVAIVALLFLIPERPWALDKSRRLLEWRAAQDKLPWGLFLLAGGGFALAEGAKRSGLSQWVVERMGGLSVLSPEVMVILLCVLTTATTEVISNSTMANIFLPVVSQAAVALKVNPLFFMLPVTVSCSYAFMLPVATAPNLIVFENGRIRMSDMMSLGFGVNIICCMVQVLMINTLGNALFDLKTFPDWANITTPSPVNGTTEGLLLSTPSI